MSLNSNETINYLNISTELPLASAIILYGYILPPLLLVTVITVVIVVVVLSRPCMRSPTNLVLMSMALADMFTVLIPSPWYIYSYSFNNHYKPLSEPWLCYSWDIMHEILPNLLHTASVWLTLLLAGQRYIYVCHPDVAPRWCTESLMKKLVASVFGAAMVHQSTRFIEYSYSSQPIGDGSSYNVCARIPADWIKSPVVEDLYYSYYYWFRVILVHNLPCITLVIFNMLLAKAMRKARITRSRLISRMRREANPLMRTDSNRTTWMLIVVVTIVLVVEIPLGVVTCLHIFSIYMSKPYLNYDVATNLILVTNFIIMFSYPFKYAIYCGMSRQFRQVFTELFVRDTPRNELLSRQSSTKKSCVESVPMSICESVL